MRQRSWPCCSSLPDHGSGAGKQAGNHGAGSGTDAPAAAPLTEAQKAKAREEQLKNDWPWLGKFKEADLALGAPAAGENRVVFMGDSITEGWHLDESFPGKPYINRGISGQTTPQMVLRFRQDVIDLKPKVVVILAGTNDIAGNTGPMTLEQIGRQSGGDGGVGDGQPHSRGAVLGAAGLRLSLDAGNDAGAEDRRAERVDRAMRRKRATFMWTTTRP